MDEIVTKIHIEFDRTCNPTIKLKNTLL